MVEHFSYKEKVVGSIPTVPTKGKALEVFSFSNILRERGRLAQLVRAHR